jgi:hypothetical protein
MHEKVSNILSFPVELKDLVEEAENEVLQSIMNNDKFKKYRHLLNTRFKGTVGDYMLHYEYDNMQISITFEFKK